MMGLGFAGAGLGVILSMGVALWWVGNQALGEFKKRTELEMQVQINQQTYEAEKRLQQALAAKDADYQKRIRDNAKEYTATINDLTAKLTYARENAYKGPIQFGDDISAEFIRVDCLLSLDPESPRYRKDRQACGDGSAAANTTGAQLLFSALTPEFWRRYGEDCNQWEDFPAKRDREEFLDENPWFDQSFCNETLVTLTPEASRYLTIFLAKTENYAHQLIEVAQQRGDIINQLSDNPILPEGGQTVDVTPPETAGN